MLLFLLHYTQSHSHFCPLQFLESTQHSLLCSWEIQSWTILSTGWLALALLEYLMSNELLKCKQKKQTGEDEWSRSLKGTKCISYILAPVRRHCLPEKQEMREKGDTLCCTQHITFYILIANISIYKAKREKRRFYYLAIPSFKRFEREIIKHKTISFGMNSFSQSFIIITNNY